MGERLALLLLGVGVDDDHQLARIVGGPEEQVVDRVERILAAIGSDGGDIAPGVVRPRLVVEQDDPAPVASGAEDALVVAHRVALLLAAEKVPEPRGILERPGRKRCQQEGRPVEARVHVECDVHPAPGSSFDELEAAARRLEPVPGHEVRDLQPHAGALCGPDRLGDRLVGALVSPTCVRRVDAVVLAADAAHRDELVLVCPALRRVLEAGRVPPRALLERLVEEVFHRRQLVGTRRAVGEADDCEADLAVGRQARHVDRRRRLLEALEVPGRRRPGQRDVGRVPVDRLRRQLLVQQGEAAEAAVPDDLERDALVDGARGAGIDEQGVVGVAVDIDEARGDDLAHGVDLGVGLGHDTDGDDAPLVQADIG